MYQKIFTLILCFSVLSVWAQDDSTAVVDAINSQVEVSEDYDEEGESGDDYNLNEET